MGGLLGGLDGAGALLGGLGAGGWAGEAGGSGRSITSFVNPACDLRNESRNLLGSKLSAARSSSVHQTLRTSCLSAMVRLLPGRLPLTWLGGVRQREIS